MFILKKYLFGFFLVDYLILKQGLCNQFQYFNHEEKIFSNAQNFCQSHNLTLPILETRDEYQDFWNFLEEKHMDEVWLGLQWNYQDGGFYQWLNGNILGIQNWAEHEPRSQAGLRCVYADGNRHWWTSPCSNIMNVICFYGDHRYAHPSHTGVTVANYATANKICRETGGRLPVIVTLTDDKLLYSARDMYMYTNFWLGLVENDEGQFVWITGKRLGFYHWYENDGLGCHVHAHHEHQSIPYVSMHAPPEEHDHETEHFCCQNKTIENANVGSWSDDYYILVERNAIPLVSPRFQVNVRRGPHCAVVCSRDVGCLKYTVDGTICRTFGDVDFVVSKDGVSLFQKVWNW